MRLEDSLFRRKESQQKKVQNEGYVVAKIEKRIYLGLTDIDCFSFEAPIVLIR